MTAFVRPKPNVSLATEFYWSGGEVGELRFAECQACKGLQQPPGPICRYCRSRDIGIRVVSGRARVAGFSINVQQWSPTFPAPYVVAIVQVIEDPRVHLTTNIVNCDPADVVVGMPVQAVFEQVGDAWVPLFEPVPGGEAEPITYDDETEDVQRYVRPIRVGESKFEHRVAITGIGMSKLGRRQMLPTLEYTVDACERAIEDAGLDWSDIDGLSTYPGPGDNGMTEGGIAPVEDLLRIRPVWFNSGVELPGQIGSISTAMMAVASGLCRHVLCYRTVWQASEADILRRHGAPPAPNTAGGGSEWRAPYGATKAVNILSAAARLYMHRYGATRETLGWIAVNNRRNASLNPTAVYRDPITMDDYLDARMIADPFGLLDCDVPVDGAVAIIVSARETAVDLRKPPVYVEAVGQQMVERPSWDQGTMSYLPGAWGNAAHMWSRTDLRPDDIDFAELYDGFTFNCLSWIEALGFCGKGEAKDFLDGGKNIALDGVLPLNTHGGQLSHGRLHGYGFVHEAVTQLRREAGERQVANARHGVAAAGGLAPGGVMLLTNES